MILVLLLACFASPTPRRIIPRSGRSDFLKKKNPNNDLLQHHHDKVSPKFEQTYQQHRALTKEVYTADLDLSDVSQSITFNSDGWTVGNKNIVVTNPSDEHVLQLSVTNSRYLINIERGSEVMQPLNLTIKVKSAERVNFAFGASWAGAPKEQLLVKFSEETAGSEVLVTLGSIAGANIQTFVFDSNNVMVDSKPVAVEKLKICYKQQSSSSSYTLSSSISLSPRAAAPWCTGDENTFAKSFATLDNMYLMLKSIKEVKEELIVVLNEDLYKSDDETIGLNLSYIPQNVLSKIPSFVFIKADTTTEAAVIKSVEKNLKSKLAKSIKSAGSVVNIRLLNIMKFTKLFLENVVLYLPKPTDGKSIQIENFTINTDDKQTLLKGESYNLTNIVAKNVANTVSYQDLISTKFIVPYDVNSDPFVFTFVDENSGWNLDDTNMVSSKIVKCDETVIDISYSGERTLKFKLSALDKIKQKDISIHLSETCTGTLKLHFDESWEGNKISPETIIRFSGKVELIKRDFPNEPENVIILGLDTPPVDPTEKPGGGSGSSEGKGDDERDYEDPPLYKSLMSLAEEYKYNSKNALNVIEQSSPGSANGNSPIPLDSSKINVIRSQRLKFRITGNVSPVQDTYIMPTLPNSEITISPPLILDSTSEYDYVDDVNLGIVSGEGVKVILPNVKTNPEKHRVSILQIDGAKDISLDTTTNKLENIQYLELQSLTIFNGDVTLRIDNSSIESIVINALYLYQKTDIKLDTTTSLSSFSASNEDTDSQHLIFNNILVQRGGRINFKNDFLEFKNKIDIRTNASMNIIGNSVSISGELDIKFNSDIYNSKSNDRIIINIESENSEKNKPSLLGISKINVKRGKGSYETNVKVLCAYQFDDDCQTLLKVLQKGEENYASGFCKKMSDKKTCLVAQLKDPLSGGAIAGIVIAIIAVIIAIILIVYFLKCRSKAYIPSSDISKESSMPIEGYRKKENGMSHSEESVSDNVDGEGKETEND